MPRLDALSGRNMIGFLRNGFQLALNGLFPYFAGQVKKLLTKFFLIILALGIVTFLILSLIMAQVKDSSTNSEQAIAIRTAPWWKLPEVVKVLKDVLVIVATLIPYCEPLTERNLVKHRNQLGNDRLLLQTCFNVAINGFRKEPMAVQQNARLLIQCDGLSMEFLAGKGHCEISVLIFNGKIQYTVKELTAEMYYTRMLVREEPWSPDDLLRVKHTLKTWGILSEILRKCLQVTLQKFIMEPLKIQSDVYMLVDCGGHIVKFVSGKKGNYVYIHSDSEGTIYYQVSCQSLWTQVSRFWSGTKDDTLQQVITCN
ncbi:uncharacterized protein PHA67_003330 isoform 1-T1 [Liasis olivaceus]